MFDVNALLQFEINAQQLGFEFGSGAAIGGIIGFAAKKIAKLIAVLVGVQLAVFKFLESRGILSVNWDQLGATFLTASDAATADAPPAWMDTILSTLSVSAGFSGGFLVGFKRG